MELKEIPIQDLTLNPFTAIAKEWMLITAGTQETGYNTMTASWGHLGSVWGHGGGLPTSVVYVRPQRYTTDFLNREDYYSLSFFPESYRSQLAYLGSRSGRNGDKIAESGLTPVFGNSCTWFAQAKLVLICRKLYSAPLIEAGFHDRSILETCYPQRDLHQMYLGEVVKVLASQE